MLRLQGINAIIALVGVFAVLHLSFAPEQHSLRTTLSTLLGGIGFLLMTCSVVLATRLEVFEEMFGGLDRMYQVHRVAGTFTAVFALVHFFSIPKELPAGVDPILSSTFPSAQIGMASMVLLVIGLFVALNRKISYSRWRNPHKVMALVYILVIGHFMNAPGIFYERFSASGIVLILAALIGTIALIYTMFGMNKRTAMRFTIETVNSLERATEVVLKPVGDMLKFKPGQFAFVEIQGKGWSEPHPFTISSAPNERRLRFTMKVLGDWTRKVREELQPGREVIVRGPYGRFDASKTECKKQVWIAGGIGLTPFLSKLRAMSADDDREINFAYAARNREEAIFLEELEAVAADRSNLTLYPLFSDEGDFARVDAAKERLPDELTEYEYFICGPKPMVDGLMKDLKKEGVKRKAIHVEAFEFR
ncbi:ferric reductase-like transmembrane domain-containing protein [Roseibium porphyridii]|uniref:Ferric reductase-like transmembrane domain-containing protein n=1 Tax=Roseibium porphyridii TaxID=2866279 RepID=A0ABY8F962_9HYPH|nr:ferric reductase-like transmembrane domain-containing protein [Roseibium sp. KMA01]WFE91089.1 ferric reductase-like transmembrane domain-containing protein [Roseibium sp. KMA01]